MSKITEYPSASVFDDGDVLLKDGVGGTKKIGVNDAAIDLAGRTSSNMHRQVWRSNSLGTSVTSEQKAAIANGTFKNMFVGDYWTINNISWRIVDINYWLRRGNNNQSKNHVLIMPDRILDSGVMNASGNTDGAYINSDMYKTGLDTAKQKIFDAFGEENILEHNHILTNATSNGHDSGVAWTPAKVVIPTEIMIYGCYICKAMNYGQDGWMTSTSDIGQLSAFRLSPVMININREPMWLRDTASPTNFCSITSEGRAINTKANTVLGVRPVFAIVGN